MLLTTVLLFAQSVDATIIESQDGSKIIVESLAPIETEDSHKRHVKIGDKFYQRDDIVCIRHRPTGTRHKKKTCAPARMWESKRHDVEEFQHRYLQGVKG